MAAICGIYKITEKSTGKCYIGQSIDIFRRLKEHHNNISDEWHLKFHEHPELFSLDILEQCEPSELDAREKYYITYFNSYYDGFNKTRGNGELIDNYIIKIKPYPRAEEELSIISKMPSVRQLAIKIFESSQETTFNNILYLKPWDDYGFPTGLKVIEIRTATKMKYPDWETQEYDYPEYFGRFIILCSPEEKAWELMLQLHTEMNFSYELFYLMVPKGKGYSYSRTYHFNSDGNLLCDITL